MLADLVKCEKTDSQDRVAKFISKNRISDSRENKYLSNEQLFYLLDKILFEKELIINKKRDESAFYLDKNELADPVDEASINVQTSQELRFRNREVFYLKKLDKSLSKIAQGIYGLCQDCNEEIVFERLKARPTAELCICCKEESELGEKNSIFGKKSKSLGQTFNTNIN